MDLRQLRIIKLSQKSYFLDCSAENPDGDLNRLLWQLLLSTQDGSAEPLQQEVHEQNKENKSSPTIPAADCGHTEKLLFLQATRALKK